MDWMRVAEPVCGPDWDQPLVLHALWLALRMACGLDPEKHAAHGVWGVAVCGTLLGWACMLALWLIQMRPYAVCTYWNQHTGLVQQDATCSLCPKLTLCSACVPHSNANLLLVHAQ